MNNKKLVNMEGIEINGDSNNLKQKQHRVNCSEVNKQKYIITKNVPKHKKKNKNNRINKEKRYKDNYGLKAHEGLESFKMYNVKPWENNRPMMETLYISGQTEVEVIGYVSSKFNKSSCVVTDICSSQGHYISDHCIIKDLMLSEFIGKVIKFRGEIYQYKNKAFEDSDIKYGMNIISDIEVVDLYKRVFTKSDNFVKRLGVYNYTRETDELIDDFNRCSDDVKCGVYKLVLDETMQLSAYLYGSIGFLPGIIRKIFLLRPCDILHSETPKFAYDLSAIMLTINTLIQDIQPTNHSDVIRIILNVITSIQGISYNKMNYDVEEFTKYCHWVNTDVKYGFYIFNDILSNIDNMSELSDGTNIKLTNEQMICMLRVIFAEYINKLMIK